MKALSSALCIAACLVLAAPPPPAHAFSPKPRTAPSKLENTYAHLLARYRPDLAEEWNLATPADEPFIGLDEASAAAHVRQLRELAAQARALPPSARAESLAVRLEREIAQTEPGGALHRDHLLWLDIVSAAARAPVVGTRAGCTRAWRITRQLRAVPEALRGAAVLLRDAPAPDSRAFETRISRVEWLFRQDLPSRTEACREPRRLAEFTQVDTLAARALAVFRRRVTTAP